MICQSGRTKIKAQTTNRKPKEAVRRMGVCDMDGDSFGLEWRMRTAKGGRKPDKQRLRYGTTDRKRRAKRQVREDGPKPCVSSNVASYAQL